MNIKIKIIIFRTLGLIIQWISKISCEKGTLLNSWFFWFFSEIMPKTCNDVKCGSIVKYQCPADSLLVHNVSGALLDCCKKSVRCICNLSSCKVPKCGIGFESVLHRKGDLTPGSCCDQYVCQRSGKSTFFYCVD